MPTFAEETLARAVAVLGDERGDEADREDAGLVIQAILVQACPSEADLTDLLVALSRALDVHLAIRRVLGAVQRLKPPAVVERAGSGVERLMDRAHRDGEHEALAELLLVALEDERWSRFLRGEWGKAAVSWAVNGLPARKYPTALLIGGWLHAIGRLPPGLRELVEEHPDLVTSAVLPRETRWQLHRAAPTVAGWRSFACALGWMPVIEPALFGHEADVAAETLQQAIGESIEESARLRLRLWLRELTGTTL